MGDQPHPLFPPFPGDVHRGWDAAKPAATTGPVTQLCHSPARTGWNFSILSEGHFGAAPGPSSSFFTQGCLEALEGPSAILLSGLEGS